MDITHTRAYSNSSMTVSCHKNKKQEHPQGKKISPCTVSVSLKKELHDLSRLGVKPSTVKCSKGSGLGLFSTRNTSLCNHDGKIFSKGDTFLRGITGILAFRHLDPKTNQYLEWLHYEKLCTPLSNDSHVLWSPYKVNDLELGIMPDGPSIFINDSTKSNCKIDADIKKDFRQTQEFTISSFPHNEIPIEFKFETLKAIPPDTELLWCYRPEAKHSKSNKNRSSSVNYQAKYLKKNHTQFDYKLIEEKMRSAFSDNVSVEIKKDFNDILKQRLENEETQHKEQLEYNNEEKKLLPLIEKNHYTRGQVLQKAQKNLPALKAYLKYRLNNGYNTFQTLNNTRTIFSRLLIPVPHKPYSIDNSHCKWGFYDLYRFCFDNHFFRPEDDIMSISLEWLGEKIEQEREESRWIILLRKRLRIVLLKNNNLPTFAENLQRYVPNPLRNYEKSWLPEEIERLGGVIKLTQNIITPQNRLFYTTKLKNSPGFHSASREVYKGARTGNIEAQRLIISRRLKTRPDLASLLIDLRKSKVDLLVSGTYKSPDKAVLQTFIKQQFNEKNKRNFLDTTHTQKKNFSKS